ncbi:MAG: FKBP-type peptidyl-prolyl cis-trans isomerase [Saprospiraceae bacterium]|nr:FKBP-type peptidyl-prolyl cis-trans isomerase [Saprospiraceae bacterium]
MRYFTFLLALVGFLFFSCNKDKTLTPEEQLQEDIRIIQQYLADKNLTATATSSGLHHIIAEAGTGGHPTLQSNVKVKYKGYFTNGSVFDENTSTFPLSNLITGWQEAIPLLQKGGKGIFLLPSYLAYGPSGLGPIPPNTVLIFDIELIDF